jgi:very-short-patch-repair endonuclease
MFDLNKLLQKCESPAEKDLLLALERIEPQASKLGFELDGQFEVPPYRTDFAFVAQDGRKLVVEVDGHDFHEKTPEQAGWDKKRDRYLVLGGWRVVRFTGTEVHRSAFTCASEVLVHLQQIAVTKVQVSVIEAVAKTMVRLTKMTAEKKTKDREAYEELRRRNEKTRQAVLEEYNKALYRQR